MCYDNLYIMTAGMYWTTRWSPTKCYIQTVMININSNSPGVCLLVWIQFFHYALKCYFISKTVICYGWPCTRYAVCCLVEQNLVQVNFVLLNFIEKSGERQFYCGQLAFLVDYFNLIWEVLVICSLWYCIFLFIPSFTV